MSLFHFPRPLSDRFCSVSSDTPRHPSHTHSRDFTYERLAPLFILHHYCLPFYPRPPPPRVPYSSPSASLLLPCRRVSVWPLLLSLLFLSFFFHHGKGRSRSSSLRSVVENVFVEMKDFFLLPPFSFAFSLADSLSLNSILIAGRWMGLRGIRKSEREREGKTFLPGQTTRIVVNVNQWEELKMFGHFTGCFV